MNKKQTFSIAIILGAGALLAWLILGTSRPQPASEEDHDPSASTGDTAAAQKKGPHGGKLFTRNGYGIEVTIFEQGVAPQFRVYAYRDGKPLVPATNQVVLTLERLGRPPQLFKFAAEQDYLKGDAIVEEPHS